MYDVAVIGAGPVGSRLAYRLAGQGYRVVVVEQKERLDAPSVVPASSARSAWSILPLMRPLFTVRPAALKSSPPGRGLSGSGGRSPRPSL